MMVRSENENGPGTGNQSQCRGRKAIGRIARAPVRQRTSSKSWKSESVHFAKSLAEKWPLVVVWDRAML